MSFELLLLGVDSTVSMASYTCIIFVIFNAYYLLINDYDYDYDYKIRGEYFTKFPNNYRGKVPSFCGIYLISGEELSLLGHFHRGKVSPNNQVSGKSLTIWGNLLCIAH